MSRLAVINDQHLFSGTSTQIYRIFQNLKKQGNECGFYQFLVNSNGVEVLGDIQPVYGYFSKFPVNSKTIYDLKLAINFLTGRNWKQFKRIDADVAILSGPTLLPLSSYFKVTIVEGHDLYFIYERNREGVLGTYMRMMYKQFDDANQIIVNSDFTKKEFIKELGISPNKISIVYRAVDSSIFHPGESDIRLKLHLDKKSKLLLSVGGDNPNKNIETIIRLLKSLPNEYVLLRVGRNFYTEKLVDDLGLKTRVIFLGNVSESFLAELYRGCDILLFPSIFEGFGIPVIEALSSGLPCLVSNRTALPEILGDAGILCEPYDLDCWKNSIIDLMTDETLYKTKSEKGIRRASFFSMENQYSALKSVIDNLE
jgi:glycosyltransferase involved in cell wall biosynthesis